MSLASTTFMVAVLGLAQPPLETPERTSWLDVRAEPIALVRSFFAFTMEDRPTVTDPSGATLQLDSTKAPRSAYGHRRGFVLENVEVGLRGRFAVKVPST
jgi:hypothetical protein